MSIVSSPLASRASRLASSRPVLASRASRLASSRLCALIALVAAFPASAVTEFPDSKGTHDIATAESWNGVAPGSTLEALFKTSGVYTASADFTVKSMHFYGDSRNNAYELDMTSGLAADACRTVTVAKTSGSALGFEGSSSGTQRSPSLTVRGGYWLFAQGSLGDSGYRALKKTSLTITDGAVLTNLASVTPMTYSQSGRKLYLKGRSRVYARGGVSLSTNSSSDGLVSVTDGSELHYSLGGSSSSQFTTDCNGYGQDRLGNQVLVEGAGSRICGPSAAMIIGNNKYESFLTVRDGGEVSVNSLSLGTCENRLVADHATLATRWELTVGSRPAGNAYFANGCNAAFISNSTVTCGSSLCVGSNSSSSNSASLVASRLTTASMVRVGTPAAAGNVLTATEGTVITNTATSTFTLCQGTRSRVTLDDSELYAKGTVVAMSETGNVVRIENGSKLLSADAVSVASSATAVSNRLFVGTGSRVTAGDHLYLSAPWCELVISNGTASSEHATLSNWTMDGVQIGYNRTPSQNFGTNCTVRFEGETPRLASAGQITVWYSSTLEWVVPPAGFAAGHVPMVGSNITFCANVTLKADPSAWLASESPAPNGRASFPLLYAAKNVEMYETSNLGKAVKAANAKIDAAERALGYRKSRYAFRMDASSRRLYLDVRRPGGFACILR